MKEETFIIDDQYLKEQFHIAIVRYFFLFNPRFWRDFLAAKGLQEKTKTFLIWPDTDW